MSWSLKIGTRTSALALWQTERIVSLLHAAHPLLVCEIVPFVTRGDRTLDQPLPAIGGKGLFTAELEEALRSGAIDLAVHSLKDLPVESAPGLCLGAVADRTSVQDVLVARSGWTLAGLPAGARVGTSSLRRAAQLLAVRPDLQIASIRGNIDTRIRKVLDGAYAAAVLAGAGLQRLALDGAVSEWLPLEIMLPAPGQGALAVQCRSDDDFARAQLAAIHEPHLAAAVSAERAFLSALGGGCSTPVAAYAALLDGSRLHLRGLVASPDGRCLVRVAGEGTDPAALGARLAAEALASGAQEILAHV